MGSGRRKLQTTLRAQSGHIRPEGIEIARGIFGQGTRVPLEFPSRGVVCQVFEAFFSLTEDSGRRAREHVKTCVFLQPRRCSILCSVWRS